MFSKMMDLSSPLSLNISCRLFSTWMRAARLVISQRQLSTAVRRTSAPFIRLAAAWKTFDLLLITMPLSPRRRDHENKEEERSKMKRGFKPQTLNHAHRYAHAHTLRWCLVPTRCPWRALLALLHQNTEGRGQNNLYLLNKTLKDRRATSCSLPSFPSSPPPPYPNPPTHTHTRTRSQRSC